MVTVRQVYWTKDAQKFMDSLPADVSERIYKAVRKVADGNNANVVKLVGSPYYRLRVGKWRVIFNDDGVIVEIIEIGSRGSIYKRR